MSLVLLLLWSMGPVPALGWTTGTVPSIRYGMGFTGTPDGKLYCFGGMASPYLGICHLSAQKSAQICLQIFL